MTEKKPLWAKCRKCGHCWAAAYAPMALAKMAQIIKNALCPMCGDRKPVVAKQDNGTLLEETVA